MKDLSPIDKAGHTISIVKKQRPPRPPLRHNSFHTPQPLIVSTLSAFY